MNKTELIDAVAKKSGQSKAQTAKVMDHVLDLLQDSLAQGEAVQLIGFGSFSVNERAARQGRNPQTGEMIQLPAKKMIKFKPGKQLAEAVADNKK